MKVLHIAASDRGQRIPELDGLRGIAIGLVVLYHGFEFGPGPDYHAKDLIHHLYLWFEGFIAIGWTGVDLFFVLSGFLIGGILLDTRDSPRYYRTFYARRFFRIVPPYYGWIFLYMLLMALAGTFLRSHVVNGSAPERCVFWMQLLFLQNFGILNRYPTVIGAWLRPTWSLAIEEQFYLVAPAVIKLLSRRVVGIFLGAVIAFAPLLRLFIYYRWPGQRTDLGMICTLMPCRADALGIGILAALLWRDTTFRSWLSQHRRTLYASAALFVAGFMILGKWSPSFDSLPMQSFGYTWIAFSFAFVLLLCLAEPTGPIAWLARMTWLRELGRVSYCLYLIHYGLQLLGETMLAALIRHVHSWEGLTARALTAVISYGSARASWKWFEHPLVKKGHAFKY